MGPDAGQSGLETGQLSELSALRREQFRIRAILEEISGRLTDLAIASGASEVSRAREEAAANSRVAAEWRTRAIEHLKSLDAALSDPNLDETFACALTKAARDLARRVAPIGLDVIAPEPGDMFDERVHRALGGQNSSHAPGSIARRASQGYRAGDVVIEPAEVWIAQPGPIDNDIPVPPPGPEVTIARPPELVTPKGPGHVGWKDPRAVAIVLLAVALTGAVLGHRTAPPEHQIDHSTLPMAAPMATPMAAPRPAATAHQQRVQPTNPVATWLKYVVRPGDTPWKIAERYYGSGRRYPLILAANSVRDEQLRVGTILLVPGGRADAADDPAQDQR